MQSPLFSIIIPAYNVERFVDKCMESILSQSFTDYEIIVINDGSTDETLNKFQKYADNEKLKIISKPNGGLSSARNAGLEAACGEYISWFDPDDYLEPDTLQRFADHAGCDVIIGGYRLVNELTGKTKIILPPNMSAGDKDGSVDVMCRLLARHRLFGYAWNKMFRRSVIVDNGLKFYQTIKKHEDKVFMFEFMNHMESVKIFDAVVYNYRKNTNSITNSIIDPANSADAPAYTRAAIDKMSLNEEQRGIVERDFTDLLTFNVVECYKGRRLPKPTRMRYMNLLFEQHCKYPTKKSRKLCFMSPAVSDFRCCLKYAVKGFVKGLFK